MEPWAGGLEEQGHSPRPTHQTRERQRPHPGHHRWGKEGNHLIHAHCFINPHQNCLLWSVTWSYKHLGGRLGAMGHTASLLPWLSCNNATAQRKRQSLKYPHNSGICLRLKDAFSIFMPRVIWILLFHGNQILPLRVCMLQLKILHAARKTEDPTCHNQDPAGPSENIHKYLKSTTEVVITAQCIECLLSNTSLKAFPIDIPYIVKSCHIHPKIQMLQWLPIYRRGN